MKTSTWKNRLVCTAATAAACLIASGCGNSGAGSNGTTGEDASSSGTVASMVGGANSSGTQGGSLGFYNEPALKRPFQWADLLLSPVSEAWAGTLCPTIGGSASGCNAGSGEVTMDYSGCSFKGSAATWSGSQVITASGITCSGFGSPSSVTRTFGADTVRTAVSGSSVEIDTSGALTLTKNGSPGVSANGTSYTGGTTLTLSGGVPSALGVSGINYIGMSAAGIETFSHTLYTSGSLTFSSSGGVTTVSGTVNLVHNLMKITGTAVLSGVTFQAGCCQPMGGTITTTFAAISGTPTAAQEAFINAKEQMQFNGTCGQATYTGPEAESGLVTLAHCL